MHLALGFAFSIIQSEITFFFVNMYDLLALLYFQAVDRAGLYNILVQNLYITLLGEVTNRKHYCIWLDLYDYPEAM